jgi:CubicO group peptidase (beta-lactamase class C family)
MTRSSLLSCALAFCLPVATFAQTPAPPVALPDSPVGRAVGLFVTALNSGSLVALEKFHKDRGGDPEAAQQDLQFAEQSGGLELRKVAKASDFEIDVEAVTRGAGRAVMLHFVVEPTPPHPVADIGVRPLGAPGPGGPDAPGGPGGPGGGGPQSGPRPAADVIAGAPALVDAAIAVGFSGAVLIAKDGKPVLERASGLANRSFEVKNRIDTKFNLGSINKTFTKLAIAQLAAEGKLSLDDKLGKFLPDFANADAAAKVTIAHLIEMKSGLGDFFGREFDQAPKNWIRTLADYVPFFAKKPLAFEPGTAEAYSNGGYLTLGLIIEKVSGQTYYDYVRDHIFKPAGMADTDYYELDAVTSNLAVGYVRRNASNMYALPARGSSAGGGYSTAPDLLKYAEALLAGRLVSMPYTRWYLGGPRPDEAKAPAPAATEPLRGGLGIAGGSPGVNAVLEINAAQRLVIVVLTNDDAPAAEDLARKIRRGN